MQTLFWNNPSKNKNTDVSFWWDTLPTNIDIYLHDMMRYAEKNAVLDKEILKKINVFYQNNKKNFHLLESPLIPQHRAKPLQSEWDCTSITLCIAYSIFGLAFLGEILAYASLKYFYEPQSARIAEPWLKEILNTKNLSPTERTRLESFLPDEPNIFSSLSSPFFIFCSILILSHLLYLYRLRDSNAVIKSENEKIEKQNIDIEQQNKEINKKNSMPEKNITDIGLSPDSFMCPIDLGFLHFPTYTTGGQTYTRSAITLSLTQEYIHPITKQRYTNQKDPITETPCTVKDLKPNTLLELILYIATADSTILSDEEKTIYIKTLLQDPCGKEGELLKNPVVFSSGFTCSKNTMDSFAAKDPLTGKELTTSVQNFALNKIIEELKLNCKTQIDCRNKTRLKPHP